MLRAAVAEEVLALLTSRERAGAVAGDLAEEAGRRGRIWFGCALLGVALALFASAFGASRARVLWLFVSGFVAWFAIYAAVRTAGAALGVQPLTPAVTDPFAAAWPVQLYLAATLALSGVLAGAALGARAPHGGLNACAPLAMFWVCAALVLPVLDLVAGTATWYCTLLYVLGLPLMYVLPLVGGGALGARRFRASGD